MEFGGNSSDAQSGMSGNGEVRGVTEAEFSHSAVENDFEKRRKETQEEVNVESDSELSNYGAEYEEYGVDSLSFNTTEKELEELWKEYQIPNDVTLRLLREGETAGNLDEGEIMVYIEMFKLGFRLSIQPYFARMLAWLGLSPGQLDPNGWRILSGMYVVWAEQNEADPCFKEFSHLYLCNEHGIGHKGWYYVMSNSKDRRIVLDFPGSCRGWKTKYFVVGGNWGRDVELSKGWFKVPTQFGIAVTWKRNVSVGEKLRARVANGLLNAEDWKRLLTPERLFSAGLISSIPQNNQKKKVKGNMSTSKRTPAEIAKALIEEMSDEEREPHNKKSRRAVHKSKDDKKEKQAVASVRNVLPQDEDNRVGDVRPLCILPPTSSPICPKENLLESDDIVESKRGKVESLLPMVNLVARSLSQSTLDDLAHSSTARALELLIRSQAEQYTLMVAHFEMLTKSLKGHAKIEELERALTKSKQNNEKTTSERDRLKRDLSSKDEDNVRLAKDLVTEKQANASKDATITELNHQLENVDQRARLEKRRY